MNGRAPLTLLNPTGNLWRARLQIGAGDAEGLVTFSIAYADLAANPGTSVTATTDATTVTVDKTVPTVSTVTIASNNALPARAKVGDTITVTFTGSETLLVAGGSIANRQAVIANPTGNTYTATLAVEASDQNGPAPFSLALTDRAGNPVNAGTPVTATTDATTVTIDVTPPVLAAVTLYAVGTPTPGVARAGNIVILEFTANEAIPTPTVLMNGRTPLSVRNPSGFLWRARLLIGAADPEAPVTFSLAYTDLAGNPNTPYTNTTDGTRVTIDKTAPIVDSISIASNNPDPALARPGDLVTVTYKSSELLLAGGVEIANRLPTIVQDPPGLTTYLASYLTEASDQNRVIPFSLTLTDLVGNPANLGTPYTTTTDGTTVTFDSVPPVLTAVTIATANPDPLAAQTGDTVTLTFTANEPLRLPAPGFTTRLTTVTLAGRPATITPGPGNTYTASITLQPSDPLGPIPFNIAYYDLAGNQNADFPTTTDGRYVTNRGPAALGTTPLETAANPTPAARPGRLAHLSARVRLGGPNGEQTVITGFVLGGDAPQRLLLRAAGPALGQFGVAGTLAHPGLRLYDATGQLLATTADSTGVNGVSGVSSVNGPDLAATATRVGAFPFAQGSADAALLLDLPPGAYTLHLSDPTGDGLALAELYDAGTAAPTGTARLLNVSTRGRTGTGDAVLIGGFTVAGDTSKTLIIRGIGPSLAALGVADAALTTGLRLYAADGTLIAIAGRAETLRPTGEHQLESNPTDLAAAAHAAGAFALAPTADDAAVLVKLPPGSYTAHVTAPTAGVALIEIYEVP
jgi:hypothetical protein